MYPHVAALAEWKAKKNHFFSTAVVLRPRFRLNIMCNLAKKPNLKGTPFPTDICCCAARRCCVGFGSAGLDWLGMV